MDQLIELIETLRRENFCLMTDEDGREIYDDQGNLLVCKSKSGECLSIPNSVGIRNLYDLPLEGGTLDVSIDKDNNAGNLQEQMDYCDDDTALVWTGQRNQKSRDATRALIELLDSPLYIQLMQDRSTVKLIVWEKIANELQSQGFRIAKTIKDAGLRTFQKWRNMERTYWRYFKNPEECGDDKRKKKPYYFDAMHAFIIKKNKVSTSELQSLSYVYGDGLFSISQNEEMDIGLTTEIEDTNDKLMRLQRVSSPIVSVERSANDEIAEETVYALVRLMVADTYRELFNGNGKKIRAWVKISDDLEASGYAVPGSSIREKSQKLFQKWRTIKKSFLNYQSYENIGVSMKKPPYYEILKKAVTKQMLIDADFSGEEPTHQSVCLQNTEHNDHDYEGVNKSVEIFDTTNPSVIPTGQCHVLETEALTTTSTLYPSESNHSSTSISSPNSTKKHEINVPKPTPPHCSRVRSCEVLQQIKALQESALGVQQQNFTKIISLLEEQVKQQNALNLLFTQYVTNQTNINKHRAKSNEPKKVSSKDQTNVNNHRTKSNASKKRSSKDISS